MKIIGILRSLGIGWSFGFIMFWISLNKETKKSYKVKKRYLLMNALIIIITIALIVIEFSGILYR